MPSFSAALKAACRTWVLAVPAMIVPEFAATAVAAPPLAARSVEPLVAPRPLRDLRPFLAPRPVATWRPAAQTASAAPVVLTQVADAAHSNFTENDRHGLEGAATPAAKAPAETFRQAPAFGTQAPPVDAFGTAGGKSPGFGTPTAGTHAFASPTFGKPDFGPALPEPNSFGNSFSSPATSPATKPTDSGPAHSNPADSAPASHSPAADGKLGFQAIDPHDENAMVEEGADLERSRRWVDAIVFYEEAAKNFPNNVYLQYGLRRSKIHFSIDRRYTDGSFDSLLLRKSPTEAYALFDEIFGQVSSSYVEPVSSTSFTAHGTESLYLALANEKFVKRHLPGATPEQVGSLRRTLRERFWNQNVEASGQARVMMQEVCRLARSTVGLAETPVILEYVFGGCNALDDYSNYLTPDRLSDLFGNIEGEFVGLGIEMEGEQGKGMLLVNVLPGSPAETGGMRAGEHIVAIDGIDCRTMSTDEAAKMLKGLPGSSVELQLSSATGQDRRSRFSRRAVTVYSVEAVQMLNAAQGVGYIRMTGFQKNTPSEMSAAITKLQAQGLKKLIWDLRGNPGGLLTAAVEVLDLFFDEGVLVSTKGRNYDQNWTYSAHRSQGVSARNVEIVLLVDGNSASASEIVAGAIRDHRRGTIIGRKTFGKWSVQSIMQLREKTGLRLTTAKFYSPHSHTYGKIGLAPDIEVSTGTRRTAFRHNDTAGLMSDADVQAALDFYNGPTVTSR